MSFESTITIFTDGSSRGNPGPGGFGVVIVHNDNKSKVESGKLKVTEIGGREERTTNNRMELQAAISALTFLSTFNFPLSTITVYTDSNYLINGITKWVHGWRKSGWLTKEKKEVLNRDLWEELFEQVQGKNITWKYVGGHVGIAGNVRCDEIATAFADNLPLKLYADILENYSIEDILDIKEDLVLAGEKKSGRVHSNAKAYSYVSVIGGVVQTHKTWAECEARVRGKPAKFKKALSADGERALIAEWSK
ncbi:MAG: ribonuclease H [bacterium]|nr:ribonuclease H [bacterium]